LKVLARDLGGLTTLQELVRESPPAQLIDGINKLVLREKCQLASGRPERSVLGGSHIIGASGRLFLPPVAIWLDRI